MVTLRNNWSWGLFRLAEDMRLIRYLNSSIWTYGGLLWYLQLYAEFIIFGLLQASKMHNLQHTHRKYQWPHRVQCQPLTKRNNMLKIDMIWGRNTLMQRKCAQKNALGVSEHNMQRRVTWGPRNKIVFNLTAGYLSVANIFQKWWDIWIANFFLFFFSERLLVAYDITILQLWMFIRKIKLLKGQIQFQSKHSKLNQIQCHDDKRPYAHL
jgi:hypothetical protein